VDRALLNTHFPAPCWGTTCFLRVGDGDEFAARLRSEYETAVVPGSFFEMPEHVRIGMGVDSAMFAEGLRRLVECGTKEGRWR
jgi:aspartate/methionine/tyrosine aminotransferase